MAAVQQQCIECCLWLQSAEKHMSRLVVIEGGRGRGGASQTGNQHKRGWRHGGKPAEEEESET